MHRALALLSTTEVRTTALVVAVLVTACGGSGESSSPTAPTLPRNQLATIIDAWPSHHVKPILEVFIDGTRVQRLDLTQAAEGCSSGIGQQCILGGGIQDVAPGTHEIRVTLVDQVGEIATWRMQGVARLTDLSTGVSTQDIDLPTKVRILSRGESISWQFQVSSI